MATELEQNKCGQQKQEPHLGCGEKQEPHLGCGEQAQVSKQASQHLHLAIKKIANQFIVGNVRLPPVHHADRRNQGVSKYI